MLDKMSSLTVHPFLWSVCLVQFGLLSVLATRLVGSKSSESPKSGNMSPKNGRVTRITMFKVPDEENQKKFVEAYNTLAKDQQRAGKPYILSVQAAAINNDPRSKGYTVVAETEFANHDDMKYYDTECPAHLVLKKASRGLGATEPPLTVYY